MSRNTGHLQHRGLRNDLSSYHSHHISQLPATTTDPPTTRFLARLQPNNTTYRPSYPHRHNAASNLRTLPSPPPPGAAARLDSPPAPIPASADITAPRRLRWQSVPTAAAATTRSRAVGGAQCVWAVRQLHQRPSRTDRLAVWPDSVQAGAGVHRAERTSSHTLKAICTVVSY
jgi:hypothetical protein